MLRPPMMAKTSASNNENLPPQVIRQIVSEVKTLVSSPIEGVKLTPSEEDITDVQATVEGPDGTPYANGFFRVKLVLGNDFPTAPPKGFFVTKIFHPNVDPRTGEICVNTLKKDWKPSHGLQKILVTIKCLLIVPNPESALNEEAGKLLLEQYDMYCKRAKMMTEIYAMPGGTSKEPSSNSHPSSKTLPGDKTVPDKRKQKDKQRKALKRL